MKKHIITSYANSLKDEKIFAKNNSMNFAFLPNGKKSLRDIKILAMDMDSTLINIECIDEIAKLAGKGDDIAKITEATMRGEIKDFKESLTKRVQMLSGVHISVLERVLNERLQLNPGAEKLLFEAHKANVHTILVSGGFTFFTSHLKQRLGLSEAYANTLEIDENGFLTGVVLGNILDGQAKADYLIQAQSKLGATANECIAIGDGSNDLLMMQHAYYAIGYHAKELVQLSDAVTCCINFGGLDEVLEFLV